MKFSRTPVAVIGAGLAVGVTLTSVGVATTSTAELRDGHFGQDGTQIAGDYWDENAQYDPKPRSLVSRPWPSASSVVSRLRARGVQPKLVSGYNSPVWERNAFLDNSGSSVNAVMVHDTGTSVPASRLRNDHSLNWIVNGVKNSKGQTVRACHLYVARNGDVHVVYTGRTWHAGAGDSMFGIPANRMNGYSYGIEIESQGGGVRDLTTAQFNSATRVVAALLDVSGLPVSRVINHKDYAGRVQGKVDTAYSAAFWRNKVNALLSGSPSPAPPAETPDPAQPASPVRANPKAISVSVVRTGATSEYVRRYQSALRSFGSKLRVPVSRINPNGATGYYGSETRRLTRVTYKRLRWNTNIPNRNHPTRRLIRRIGGVPVR